MGVRPYNVDLLASNLIHLVVHVSLVNNLPMQTAPKPNLPSTCTTLDLGINPLCVLNYKQGHVGPHP